MSKIGRTKMRIIATLFAVCILLVTLTACGRASLVGEWERTTTWIVLQEPQPPPPPRQPGDPTVVMLQPTPPPPPSPGARIVLMSGGRVRVPYPIDEYTKQEHPYILDYEQLAIYEVRITYEFFSDGNGVRTSRYHIIEDDGVGNIRHRADIPPDDNEQVTWSADGDRLLTQYSTPDGRVSRPPITRTFNVSGNTLTFGEGEQTTTFTRAR